MWAGFFIGGKGLIYFAVGGDVLRNPLVGADDRAFAYSDIAQNGGFGVNNDVIFNVRVPLYAFDGIALFIQRKAFGPQRYALVELYMFADYTGFSNDYTRAVVYKKRRPNLCARVYVYAG